MENGQQNVNPVTPEEYRQLITGLELLDVWLAKCSVENAVGPGVYAGTVEVGDLCSWSLCESGFQAHIDYQIQVTDPEKNCLGRINVRFGLRYRSEVAMTDRLFEIFQSQNLGVNSWPYLRQFVADTAGRMGWLPFTLPLLKRGTRPGGGNRA